MSEQLIKMPMVPLRGLVAFPQTVVNFEVARESSITALRQALDGDGLVFLAAQKDMRIEAPAAEDIYHVGVVARVRHILKLSDELIRVLVEGLYRARMCDLERGECYLAQVVRWEQECPQDERMQAYMRTLISRYEEYGKAGGKVSPEAIAALSEITSPSKLVDTVSINVVRKTEQKQEILEQYDVAERYDKMLAILSEEIQISALEKEISEHTREQIEKIQKESYLREQMRSIQKSLGEDEAELSEIESFRGQVQAMPVTEETKQKLKKEIARLERMNPQSPDYNVLRTYLEWVTSLPYGVYTEDNMDIKHAQEVLDSEHYGMEKVKERILEYLAVLGLKKNLKGPILCFAGPPGVGKTSIAHSIANALGRKFVRMSLGGVRDEAEIRGHRRTYIGAIPGRIISNIKQAGTMNPLFLLDEIDKMSSDYKGDPASAMLEVLDSEINATFQDHYLDIDFDLSSVMFVTTANDVDSIPRPLYDRMEIIELSSYTTYEKEQIALRHLIPKQMEENGLASEVLKIQPSAVREMISGYTCESGVRSLERVIGKVCRKSARLYLDGKSHIAVSSRNLHSFLGVPRYEEPQLPGQGQPGVAIGLAWTAAGGTTLPIEVCVMEGSGNVELTGQLGDVMKESAKAAISLIRSMADELGIQGAFYKEKDLHIHVPEGAVSKDGPSAGITIALAVASALTGRKVRSGLAMTGEITLTGQVLPIGGLKEKSLAALRMGIHRILIPRENVKDLEEIPKEIQRKIAFVPVSHFREVLKEGLEARKGK